MSDDDKGRKGKPQRQGSVSADDPDLVEWFNRLWARKEYPERAELYQVFGARKLDRGELVWHEDFKGNNAPSIEEVTRMCNELLEAAQHDVDAARREGFFQISVRDRSRSGQPLTRRVGPLQPKRTYAVTRDGDLRHVGGSGEPDDEDLRFGPMTLAALKEAHEQVKWDKTRNDRVLGDVLQLLQQELNENRKLLGTLFGERMRDFVALQDALDRKDEREEAREWRKMKRELARDGLRTARSVFPMLFDRRSAPERVQSEVEEAGEVDEVSEAPTPRPGVRDYGDSLERKACEDLLKDVEDTGLSAALFGDWDTGPDGKPRQAKAGVFSAEQLRVIAGVSRGKLAASALDALLPDSGDPRAVTPAQMQAASAAGVTDGTAMGVLSLFELRKRAREK